MITTTTKLNTQLMVGGKTNIVASALLRANPIWADLFERDKLKAGVELIHAGMRPAYAYFPVDGLVSVLVSTSVDPAEPFVQSTMCGEEDIAGLPALLSEGVATYRLVVDLDTPAWRVSAQAARRVLDDCAASRAIVNRYAALALTEAWEQAASNAAYPVRDRLVTWLLRSALVSGDKTLPFSQPHIAERMGVRRPSITDLLQAMEERGLVARERGRVKLLRMEELTAQAPSSWPVLLDHRRTYREAMERA